jgi:hypothetical protein
MTGDRIPCIAPGCRRTTRFDGRFDRYICAKHWAMIPRATRRAYLRARRLFVRGLKSQAALDRLWARCERIATTETLQEY